MAPISREMLDDAEQKTLADAFGRSVYDQRSRQYVNDDSGWVHKMPTFWSRLHGAPEPAAATPVVYVKLLPGWHGHDGRAEHASGPLCAVVTRMADVYCWRVSCSFGPEQGDQIEVGCGREATFDEAAVAADAVLAASLSAALVLAVAAVKGG